MDVGETIKLLREERGYKQSQLASIISVSPGCLSKSENGQSQIPIDVLAKIADVFETSVDYLIGRSHLSTNYSVLGNKYCDNKIVSEVLEDILALGKDERQTLNNVLIALKCKSDIEKMNSANSKHK